MAFEDQLHTSQEQHNPYDLRGQGQSTGGQSMKASSTWSSDTNFLLKGSVFKVRLSEELFDASPLGQNGVNLTEIVDRDTIEQLCLEHAKGLSPHVELVETASPKEFWLFSIQCVEKEDESEGIWLISATNLCNVLPGLLDRYEARVKSRGDLESLSVPALVLDHKGRISESNRGAAHLLGGLSSSKLVGKSLNIYLDAPNDPNKLINSPEGAVQKLALSKDHVDNEVLAASSAITFENEDATLVLLYHTALPDLAVREDDNLFEAVARNARNPILLIRTSDGTVTAANHRAAEVLGVSQGSLVGQPFNKYTTSSRDVEQLLSQIARKQRVQSFELQLSAQQGDCHILVSGEEVVRNGVSNLLLVGQHKPMENRDTYVSSESREAASKIFHASPAPTIITRESDGMIVSVNKAMTEILGRPRKEIINNTTTEIGLWHTPEDRTHLLRQIREDGPLHDYEKEIIDPDGNKRTILFSIQRIKVDGRNCLLSVGNDISSRKEAARKLEEAKEHAEAMVRFRTGILTNVTHEVRTPLTVILGFTTMLRQGVREEYSRFVDLIERSGRRLLLTLDSVLDLAQLEAGTLELSTGTYNMADLLSGTVEDLMPRARNKGTELVTEINASSAYVKVDFDLFKRALEHLIDNAIKFTENGTITLKLDSTDEEVYLHIIDTGIGIKEDFIPQIFDAFKQESTGLERNYQGSGLGLTVAKQLVEEFGGQISVTSAKGKGSTFTISLPQSDRNAALVAA